jgi:hypothetical protein
MDWKDCNTNAPTIQHRRNAEGYHNPKDCNTKNPPNNTTKNQRKKYAKSQTTRHQPEPPTPTLWTGRTATH